MWFNTYFPPYFVSWNRFTYYLGFFLNLARIFSWLCVFLKGILRTKSTSSAFWHVFFLAYVSSSKVFYGLNLHLLLFGTYFPDLFSPLDVIFTYQTGFYLNFARNPDNPLAKFIQKSCRFRDSSSLVMARMIGITLLPIVWNWLANFLLNTRVSTLQALPCNNLDMMLHVIYWILLLK